MGLRCDEIISEVTSMISTDSVSSVSINDSDIINSSNDSEVINTQNKKPNIQAKHVKFFSDDIKTPYEQSI